MEKPIIHVEQMTTNDIKGAPKANPSRAWCPTSHTDARWDKAPGTPLDKIKMASNGTKSVSSLTLVLPNGAQVGPTRTKSEAHCQSDTQQCLPISNALKRNAPTRLWNIKLALNAPLLPSNAVSKTRK